MSRAACRLMASGEGTAEDNSKLAKMLAELKEQVQP
jgi:hypothetical protein